MPANSFVSIAEADKLRPIFAAGQELGAHFFVHPGRRADEATPAAPPFADNLIHRHTTFAIQQALSMAVVTLALGDYLDSYPNVTVQVANLGGDIAFVIERMDRVARLRTPDAPPPSARVRRLYVDTASLGSRAIELAVEVFGEGRILLGTDYPVFPAQWSVDAASQVDLAPRRRHMLLHENAAALHDRYIAAAPV